MAGMYDTTEGPTGYGAATGFAALQQELLRREQMQAQAEAVTRAQAQQQFENARQLRNDQQSAELHAANIAQAKANLASQDDQRKAAIAASTEATQQKQQAELTSTTAPGPITPSTAQEYRAAGLGRLLLSQPKTGLDSGDAQPLPGTPVPVGDAAPASAPVMLGPSNVPTLTTQDINVGTQAQQATKRQEEVRRKIMTGETKVDRSDPLAMETLWKDMGGTGALPAGVVVPKAAPKTALESLSQDDVEMRKLDRRQQNVEDKVTGAVPLSPEEASNLKEWRRYHSTDAEKDNRQHVLIDVRNTNAAENANTARTERSKAAFAGEIQKANTALSTDLKRNDKALMVLSKPGWVGDSTAIPEYLQIMAGGQGSGLRMTTAEINKVQAAQSYFDQAKAKASRLGSTVDAWLGIQPQTIQDDMRAQMKELLGAVRTANARTAALHSAAIAALKGASADDVLEIRAEYMRKLAETPDEIAAEEKAGTWAHVRAGSAAAAEPAAASSLDIETVRDPKTGKLVLK